MPSLFGVNPKGWLAIFERQALERRVIRWTEWTLADDPNQTRNQHVVEGCFPDGLVGVVLDGR